MGFGFGAGFSRLRRDATRARRSDAFFGGAASRSSAGDGVSDAVLTGDTSGSGSDAAATTEAEGAGAPRGPVGDGFAAERSPHRRAPRRAERRQRPPTIKTPLLRRSPGMPRPAEVRPQELDVGPKSDAAGCTSLTRACGRLSAAHGRAVTNRGIGEGSGAGLSGIGEHLTRIDDGTVAARTRGTASSSDDGRAVMRNCPDDSTTPADALDRSAHALRREGHQRNREVGDMLVAVRRVLLETSQDDRSELSGGMLGRSS